MSHQGTITETITAYPSGFDSTNSTYASVDDISNGYNSSDNSSSPAQFDLNTGSGANTWVYYTFNMSAIPDTATITSVACIVKDRISNTTSTYITTRTVQMYAGTTAMGSTVNTSTILQSRTLSPGDSWTVAQIKNARVVFHAIRGTRNTTKSYTYDFYGATLTVGYTFEGTLYEISSSASIPNTKGVLVDTEYQEHPSTASITVTNYDGLNLMIIDNGSKTASFTNTSYTYTLNNLSADHNIIVDYNTTNFSKINNSWRSIPSVYQKSSGTWAVTTFASAFPSGTEIKQGDDLLDEKPLIKFLSNCDAVYFEYYADDETTSSVSQTYNWRSGSGHSGRDAGKTYYILTRVANGFGLHKIVIPELDDTSSPIITPLIEYNNYSKLYQSVSSANKTSSVSISDNGTSKYSNINSGSMVTFKLKENAIQNASELESLITSVENGGIKGSYGTDGGTYGTFGNSRVNTIAQLPCYILTAATGRLGLASVDSNMTITSILSCGYANNGPEFNISNRSQIATSGSGDNMNIYYAYTNTISNVYGGGTFIYI